MRISFLGSPSACHSGIGAGTYSKAPTFSALSARMYVDFEMPADGRIPFIAFDQNCFYRQWAAKELAGSDKKLDVVLECASNEGVTAAILAGMGVALIAERHLHPGMETG